MNYRRAVSDLYLFPSKRGNREQVVLTCSGNRWGTSGNSWRDDRGDRDVPVHAASLRDTSARRTGGAVVVRCVTEIGSRTCGLA